MVLRAKIHQPRRKIRIFARKYHPQPYETWNYLCHDGRTRANVSFAFPRHHVHRCPLHLHPRAHRPPRSHPHAVRHRQGQCRYRRHPPHRPYPPRCHRQHRLCGRHRHVFERDGRCGEQRPGLPRRVVRRRQCLRAGAGTAGAVCRRRSPSGGCPFPGEASRGEHSHPLRPHLHRR